MYSISCEFLYILTCTDRQGVTGYRQGCYVPTLPEALLCSDYRLGFNSLAEHTTIQNVVTIQWPLTLESTSGMPLITVFIDIVTLFLPITKRSCFRNIIKPHNCVFRYSESKQVYHLDSYLGSLSVPELYQSFELLQGELTANQSLQDDGWCCAALFWLLSLMHHLYPY